MPISIKTPRQIEKMRVAGRLAREVLHMVEPHVKSGVTTGELNDICHQYIVEEQQAIPAPLGYGASGSRPAFPKSICTSVNNVICHGIPGDKKLKTGDIINIDVTVIKDGFHGDTSKMFFVGEPSVLAKRLCNVTHQAMVKGIELVRPGVRLGDIGFAIQKHVEAERFSIVREFCGHGIGEVFHEDPQVLHYGRPGSGIEVKSGMTFTIEPMVNAGKPHCRILPDQWTAVTKDRGLSAQWEHTLLCTDDGFEVLTLTEGEPI